MNMIKVIMVRHGRLMPVIIATQEAGIRRIAVRSQHRQRVGKTLSRKNLSQKRAGGAALIKIKACYFYYLY
jgi:hypothetical protein